MRKNIPQELLKLYSDQGLLVTLYVRLRWLFCQFEKVEEHVPKDGIIIDIGCGYGIMANLLKLKSGNRHVIGADISEKRIEIAKNTIGNRKKIEFLCKEVSGLELNTCNGIVMVDFLHHIPYDKQENILTLSHKKLVDDGVLIIKEMDKAPPWKFIISYMLEKLLGFRRKLYHKDSKEFNNLLMKIGFDTEKITLHKNTPFTDILFVCKK